MICFRLDFGVSGYADRGVVVTEHHITMPRKETVPDLVSFKPAMLGLWDSIINQHPLFVREVKRPQVKLPNRINQESGSLQQLLCPTFQLADCRAE